MTQVRELKCLSVKKHSEEFFNVLGDAVDNMPNPETKEKMVYTS